MGGASFEQIGPESRELWKRMLLMILGSYLLDSLVLVMFVRVGELASWVPIAYGLTGISCCAFFYGLVHSGYSERFADSSLTNPQLVVAVCVQLAFMLLAPQASHYFIAVLFVVFAFGSLRMRERDAAIAMALLAAPLLAALALSPALSEAGKATLQQRLVCGVGILLVLARCTWLGVYGNRMRHVMRSRRDHLRAALNDVESRNARIAMVLHEDLGQQLAGVSLLLTAVAQQLRNERHAGASDVVAAASHLSDAVEKVRRLATTVDGGHAQAASSYNRLVGAAQ